MEYGYRLGFANTVKFLLNSCRLCATNDLLLSEKRREYSYLAIIPNLYTNVESLATACVERWPCNRDISLMSLHCTDFEPAQSQIQTHAAVSVPGQETDVLTNHDIIYMWWQRVTNSLLRHNSLFCCQVRCIFTPQELHSACCRLYWLL